MWFFFIDHTQFFTFGVTIEGQKTTRTISLMKRRFRLLLPRTQKLYNFIHTILSILNAK